MKRVECPICGGRFRSFKKFGERPNARCPRCGSLERHRQMWLFLTERDLLRDDLRLLHFAPEPCLEERLRGLPGYVTSDLNSGTDVRADITALPLESESFDGLLCSHVLEHVPDDGAAMREMHRVLKPGGWGIIDSPVMLERYVTFEDPDYSTGDRQHYFSQADHVRVYGRDFSDRLRRAGFRVTAVAPDEASRFGLPVAGALGADLHFCER